MYMYFQDYWSSHPDTQEFADIQIKCRRKPGMATDDSESESSSSEQELEQGSELSDDEDGKGRQFKETQKSKLSFVSKNPFALLDDND